MVVEVLVSVRNKRQEQFREMQDKKEEKGRREGSGRSLLNGIFLELRLY
jgi:hypothetical protein